MKNDDIFRSFSRMAEEYNYLVSPLIVQLNISDRWQEISSPTLRVAEMHDDVLRGVTAFDISLANKLSQMMEPYQPMLDNMIAIEKMMGTRFADLVQPQVYYPGLSSRIAMFSSEIAQIGETVQLAQPASDLFSFADQATQSFKPWETDIKMVSAYETSLGDNNNSPFGRLVEIEKTVAGLSSVISQYDHITSISAQIASLQQIGLTEAWKGAITPPDMLLGLNDFAVKQYEHIKRAKDEKSIAWRFGLIDAASKYVDTQVSWGTSLALNSEDSAPEIEIASPVFSDFPIILGPAKRDNKDVGEAFEESQLVTITDTGKIIIQKAKVVNEFCKARKMPVLFPESDLTNWALTLAGSFCIDAEKLDEVLDTLRSMFIRKPVINIIGQHKCFDDIESYSGTAEKKRKKITNIQRLVYSKIIELEDSLIKHFEGTTISIFDEDTVSCNVLKALLTIQGDKLYHEAKENNINDGIRNQLKWVYDVKDQSRLGESGSGKDAGEVDIMLFDNANPMVIMEGLILDYFKQEYLDDHIRKALDNYNPNGCPFVYILIYAKMKEFGVFWDKVMEHLSDYAFPYDTVEGIHDICTAYTDSRHAKAVLKRNGKCVNLHLFAIAMK